MSDPLDQLGQSLKSQTPPPSDAAREQALALAMKKFSDLHQGSAQQARPNQDRPHWVARILEGLNAMKTRLTTRAAMLGTASFATIAVAFVVVQNQPQYLVTSDPVAAITDDLTDSTGSDAVAELDVIAPEAEPTIEIAQATPQLRTLAARPTASPEGFAVAEAVAPAVPLAVAQEETSADSRAGLGAIIIAEAEPANSVQESEASAPNAPLAVAQAEPVVIERSRRAANVANTESAETAGTDEKQGTVSSRLVGEMRAFTVRVNQSKEIASAFRPEQIVDIYWSRTSGGKSNTKLLLEDARIIAINQLIDFDGEDGSAVKTVTLEVSPLIVGQVTQAQSSGQLTVFASGSPESAEMAELMQQQRTTNRSEGLAGDMRYFVLELKGVSYLSALQPGDLYDLAWQDGRDGPFVSVPGLIILSVEDGQAATRSGNSATRSIIIAADSKLTEIEKFRPYVGKSFVSGMREATIEEVAELRLELPINVAEASQELAEANALTNQPQKAALSPAPGMRAMTFQMDAEVAAGLNAEPGDFIDMFWAGKRQGRQLVKKIILGQIRVLAAAPFVDDNTQIESFSITLELPPLVIGTAMQASASGVVSFAKSGDVIASQSFQVAEGIMARMEPRDKSGPQSAGISSRPSIETEATRQFAERQKTLNSLIVAEAAPQGGGISLSGDARLGLIYEGEGDEEFKSTSRARVKFEASGTSDHGVTFGMDFRAGDGTESPAPSAPEEGEVFVGGSFGTITSGDTDTAIPKRVPEAESTGLGTLSGEGFVIANVQPAPATPMARATRQGIAADSDQRLVEGRARRGQDDSFVTPEPVANTERFPDAPPSDLKVVSVEPVSTFSIDVDTASYALMRSSIMNGQKPNPAAVRIEELVNYFDYDYPMPENRDVPFRTSVSVTDTPWNEGTKLIQIAIQGYDIPVAERPDANLVFLIDTSGSMQDRNKLPLLIQSFRLLLSSLGENDSVAIVTYAGSAGVVLEPTPASDTRTILEALTRLHAGGSTAGQAGLQQAYALAERMSDDGDMTRVFLATDGDFNVGISNPENLKEYVEEKRETGIYLSVLGFGRGNYNDTLMQALAQNGNGIAAYIDTLAEAQKVLVEEASGSLFPIAGDVKIQMEFNPGQIAEYRLIGYETRALKREDFNNDAVDAGEIGAGHTVTAIYEVTPVGSPARRIDDLRYAGGETVTQPVSDNPEYGFLKLRYKLPGESRSKLIETAIMPDRADINPAEIRFATAVAGFGEYLKGSDYLGDWGPEAIDALASDARGDDPFGYRSEFLRLVRLARTAQ